MSVPYRDVTKASIVEWERALAKKNLAASGLDKPDQQLPFVAVATQRRIVENATELTRRS
jgi:hypothetical protein